MSEKERAQSFLRGSIFARVSPEQKFELVQTLKAHGKVVAMTGDGVNDSPALKLADIGVSMGENATDVARATAKMVLLKNDFNGIVQAILEGRNIFSNLRRSFSYLIAFHIPVVLLAFLPPLFGWGQILFPVHIILLELIVHPISAFAFENLKNQRADKTKTLMPRQTLITALLSGLLLSFFSLLPIIFSKEGSDFNSAKSMVLFTILFGNIGFTLVEAWPNINSKRVIAIVTILFFLPFVFCHSAMLGHYFYLVKVSNMDLFQVFLIGMAASIPTFLVRIFFKKQTEF